eukprot:GHRQ01027372.1.p1 GENE.GHRQ01027372.1~~GHRQ01027372.1.p1  ORF type:complete len:177 (-),score=1.67 GHRQ01027372.1:555-1010(-)
MHPVPACPRHAIPLANHPAQVCPETSNNQHTCCYATTAPTCLLQTFAVAPTEGMALDRNEQLDLQAVSGPGTLFNLLDADNQSIVRPFLTTKFCIAPRQHGPPGDGRGEPCGGNSDPLMARTWIELLAIQLRHCSPHQHFFRSMSLKRADC